MRKKHPIGITLTSSWKKASNGIFFSKIFTIFQLVNSPFLTPVRMRKHIRMPRLKNWKAKNLHNENIKQSNGMQLTFILEIKLQKEHCSAKYHQFNNSWRVSFETLLGWQTKYVCQKLRNKTGNRHRTDLRLGN